MFGMPTLWRKGEGHNQRSALARGVGIPRGQRPQACTEATCARTGRSCVHPRVILLGTKGGPRVGEAGRSNPSTLVLINEVPYVVDCGYGTSRQLLAAGVSLNRLRYLFITHHHSDHNLEFGPLFYNAWVTGLPVRVDAYGPTGLQKMTRDFFNYLKFDIDTRIVDEGRADPRKLLSAHEFNKPGVVLLNDDVKVSAGR
jgi:metallo-beta-lactamase superfamily protein